MSYHNTSKARQSTVNAQGQVAPNGYHYMPDGTLMSDVEHARIYGGAGVIRSFNLDTTNIRASGEKRRFTITGSGAFSLIIKNESGYYYNFNTNKFQVANTRLANEALKNTYSGNISFPVAPTTTDTVDATGNAALNATSVTVASIDSTNVFSLSEAIAISDGATLSFTGSDQYDILLFAESGTKHADYNEVRFADGSIDINSSTGSDSLLLKKVIYQTLDVRLTLSAISPNGEALFAGIIPTPQVITTQIGSNTGKIPFSIPVSAGTTHSFRIDKNPTTSDVGIFVARNIGSAPIAIEGEDVSESTYYRWPIDNINGLTIGMIPLANNITAGTIISSYQDTLTIMEGTDREEEVVKVEIKALDTLGAEPTITIDPATKTITTVQTGNIVFNKQQVAALAGDAVKIYSYGTSAIEALSGWDIELSDIIVTLTKPTALVTVATVDSTTVAVDNGDGIMDDVSSVSGFNIDSSVINPTVINIASYSGATATLTLSAAQSLEAGETLTFDGAGRTITISGNIEIKKAGGVRPDWGGTLFFDLEKFITATDES